MARRIGIHQALPYQERIAVQVAEAMRRRESGSVLAPTGSGKTYMIAMAAADARAQGRPVLILSPNVDLVRQVLGAMYGMEEFRGVQVNTLLAQDEKLEGVENDDRSRPMIRGEIDVGTVPEPGDVGIATSAGLAETSADPRFAGFAGAFGALGGVIVSAAERTEAELGRDLGALLSAPAAEPARPPIAQGGLNVATVGMLRQDLSRNPEREAGFRERIRAFGEAGGVVLIDEGQGAGAKELKEALKRFGIAGATCVQFSATPWREDGGNPLEAFEATERAGLIGVATYGEVRATGRVCPTRFKAANEELHHRLGRIAEEMDKEFERIVAEGKPIETASQAAFGRHYSPKATPAERDNGKALAACIGDAWEASMPGRELAMVHCDGVPAAGAFAAEIAGRRLPHGHPRHGSSARVAMVTGDRVTMWRDGREVDLKAEFGWRNAKAQRRGVLDLAREGGLDALVNVNALGVGTDIPRVDLNILAAYRRNLSFTRQTEGRGGRAFPGKADQLFVDMGTSLSTHWANLKAHAAGLDDRVDPRYLRIGAVCLREMHAWLASDRGLDAQCDAELAARRRRRAEKEPIEDEAVPKFDEFRARLDPTVSPVPVEVRPGLSVASTYTSYGDLGPEGASYDKKTAFFMPGMVAIVEQPSGKARSLVTDDFAKARDFAAFAGVVADRSRSTGRGSPIGESTAASLAKVAATDPDGLGGWPRPSDEAAAKAQVDARWHYRKAEAEAVKAMGRRLFPDQPALQHPVATLLLDGAERMGEARIAATRGYLALAARLWTPVRIVATKAEGVGAASDAFGDLAASVGALSADPSLRAHAGAGRLAGWRPGKPGDRSWVDAAADAPARSPADRRAEERFAQALSQMRHVASSPSVGRYSDLGTDAGFAWRLSRGATPAAEEATAWKFVNVFADALVLLPPAKDKALRRTTMGVRGAGALAAHGSAPGSRLGIDRDRARSIFAAATPAARAEMVEMAALIVKQQPAERRRKPAPKEAWRERPSWGRKGGWSR